MKRMKKRFLTIALAGILAATAFAFGGCGDSAYDIAVKNGFKGTEAEWLQSLKGADGEDAPQLTVADLYNAAVADGTFTGSFNEFLQQYMSVDVPNNNDIETLASNVLSTVSVYTGFEKASSGLLGAQNKEIFCSAGSGVIIDLDRKNGNATVITNYHVVFDSKATTPNGISESIYLYLYGAINRFDEEVGKDVDGDGILAKFVGGSMDYDIAILEIQGSEILKESIATEAKFGNSNQVAVGEKVFVVGNPASAGISVSQGIVSVVSEYIEMKALNGANRKVSYRVMRTDAAINGGNSGGPMFNSKGEVIAIVNAKSIADGVENMGYALPSSQVESVIENLVNHNGELKRAMLGVMVAIDDTTVSINASGTLEVTEKLRVDSVDAGTAAEGKLQAGDIFKSMTLNGTVYPLQRRYYITEILLRAKLNDVVIVTVERDGALVDVEIHYSQEKFFTSVL